MEDSDNPEILLGGTITGVQLIEYGYVKRASNVAKELGDERVEEEEVSGDEYSSEEEIVEETVPDMSELFKRHGEYFLCAKYGKTHVYQRAVRKHYVQCKVPQRSMIFADRAVRLIKYLIDTDLIRIQRADRKPCTAGDRCVGRG